MQTVLRSTALLLLVLGVASRASAGDKVWSVAGVVNNGLATVFSCSNGSSAAATIVVEVHNKSGGLDKTITATSVPAGGTANIATQSVDLLGGATADPPYYVYPVFPDPPTSLIRGGSAVVTAPSGVYCTAYLMTPGGDPPALMHKLSVVKKTNQKGD